jgi:hypothetical protein
VAVGDGGFYIGIYEGGEILDAVNLPDDVIAFAKLIEYGVETCQTSAYLFGHKSVLSGFLGCSFAIPDFNRRIRAKAGIAFYQAIVKIRKTYAIARD